MKSGPLIGILQGLLLCGSLLAQDPLHRRYTKGNGLPSNTVYTILQDKHGFMWFGTEAGVSRFDGHVFRNYFVEDGLTDNSVIGLGEDSKGRIWLLTLNGNLCFWLNDTIWNEHRIPELGKYVSGTGWQTFAEDADGSLWFGGVRSDVVRLDLAGDRDRHWRMEHRYMMSVQSDGSGGIMNIMSGRIATLQDDEWVFHDSLRTRFINPVCYPAFDKRSPSLGIGNAGIMAINGVRWRALVQRQLEPTIHQRAYIDATGDLWVTRLDGGIEYQRSRGGGFDEPKRLFPGEVVNFSFVDREGNRWFSTARRGVVRCTKEQFGSRLFRAGTGEVAEPLISLGRMRDRVLAGSAEGSLYALERSGLVRFPTNDLGRVIAIATDHEGNAWAATDQNLLRLDAEGAGLRQIGVLGDQPGTRISPQGGAKTVAIAPDGTVWSSTFGMYRVEEEGGILFRRGLPDNVNVHERVQVLCVDRLGRAWFETNDELHCVVGDKLLSYGNLHGRTGLRITSMVEWNGDTLLIGTAGDGVLFFHEGNVVGDFTTADGLLTDDVIKLRAQRDTLLVVTSGGVVIHKGALAAINDSVELLRLDRRLVGEVSDVLVDAGELLLATGEGLCRIPFPAPELRKAPPVAYFVGHWLNSALGRQEENVRMLEERDHLRVVFRAIDFADPEGVTYQYRLEAADPWVQSADGVLEFASLASGSYVLEVRARSTHSAWSDPQELRIEVVKRWWNRSVTHFGIFFGCTAVLIFTYRALLRRQYRKELSELSEREAVNEERRRIAADVHDDLGADLSRLLLHARQAEAAATPEEGKRLTEGIIATIDKIDEIIWATDPRRDTLLSTVQFIEQEAREQATAHGLQFRTTVSVPDGDVPLDANMRRELMLIAREAVRNVVRHAHAEQIRIDWSLNDRILRLRVEDDGVGMGHTVRTGRRHGMGNMRERAVHIGAELTIQSVSPRGTRVELTFAVARNHPIG